MMLTVSYFLDRIRDVKISDYISVFPMLIALIIKPLYHKRYDNSWLICEEPAEARDNGYHFFKYMCEKQPQQKCYYAIKKNSVDANRIEKLGGGGIVEYGSIQHWLAYFLCEYNISSQKGGKPNAALCAFMEMIGKVKKRNVFLQHGVIINNLTWLYADKSHIFRFITSTVDETAYVEKVFGYPQGTVVCTGIPRFDGLHNLSVKKNQIVVMPTWRYWFNLKSKQSKETDNEFKDSEYLQKWNEFLHSPKLERLCDEGLCVIFYLHRNLQKYRKYFRAYNDNISIAHWENHDIQTLLKESALLITDYSSVFYDMVYMKKPIIFYQFDEDKYRKYQYEKGYFDYHNNPFGKSFKKSHDVILELEYLKRKNFPITHQYELEHKRLFPHYDNKNSERVYEMLSKCFPNIKKLSS